MIEAKLLNELKTIFNEDDLKAFLVECGFFSPLNNSDLKPLILSTMLDFHLMLKVKAAHDQLLEAIEAFRILNEV